RRSRRDGGSWVMSLRQPPRAGREGQLAVFGTAGGEIGGHYNRGNGGGQPAFDAFDEQSGAPQPHRTRRNTESRAYREGGIPFNRKAPRGRRRARGCRWRQAPPAAARGSTRLARRVVGRQLFSALLDRLG